MTLLTHCRPNFIRLTHPTTGRFIAEFDPDRDLLKIVDSNVTAFIDLASIRLAIGRVASEDGHKSAIDNIAT